MSQNAPEVTLPDLPEDFPLFDPQTALKVWDALLNAPEHGEEIDPEEYDGYDGYDGMDDVYEFDTVAARMRARADLFPALQHSILSTCDGAVDAYEVGVYHEPTNTYLMRFVDRKHGTYQRAAQGAAAALAYGLAIADYYNIQHALMARLDN